MALTLCWPTSTAIDPRGRTARVFFFLRELLELGAELAGEVVALLAVVPVLLPLVHILGVLLLGSPLCADE